MPSSPVDCDFRKAIVFLKDLDNPWKEWVLFFHQNRLLNRPCWEERLRRWRVHFAILQEIAGDPNGKSATDIKAMFEHLTILDSKFGMALTFNTFVLTITTFLLTSLKDLIALVRDPKFHARLPMGCCVWVE